PLSHTLLAAQSPSLGRRRGPRAGILACASTGGHMRDPFVRACGIAARFAFRAAAPGLVVLILSIVVAPRTAVAAFGTCPSSQASMRNAGVATLEAAAFDSMTTDGNGTYHVSYDLPQGHVFMEQPSCLCGAWVEATDAFDVIGVPTGTEVPLAANPTKDGTG